MDAAKMGKVKLRSKWPGDAVYDDTQAYRYVLTRDMRSASAPLERIASRALFVMLNPSVATAEYDDPTIARCVGFAQRWGCAHLTICNIFALRATDPSWLYKEPDPIGVDNDDHIIRQVTRADIVVCAWGSHGEHRDRGRNVYETISEALRARAKPSVPFALGWTKTGQPKHPLYLRKDTPPMPWTRWGQSSAT